MALWARRVWGWHLSDYREGLLQSPPGLHYWRLLVTRLYLAYLVEDTNISCMCGTLVNFGFITVWPHWALWNEGLTTGFHSQRYYHNSLTCVQTNPSCSPLPDLSVPNTTSLLNALFSSQGNRVISPRPSGLSLNSVWEFGSSGIFPLLVTYSHPPLFPPAPGSSRALAHSRLRVLPDSRPLLLFPSLPAPLHLYYTYAEPTYPSSFDWILTLSMQPPLYL